MNHVATEGERVQAPSQKNLFIRMITFERASRLKSRLGKIIIPKKVDNWATLLYSSFKEVLICLFWYGWVAVVWQGAKFDGQKWNSLNEGAWTENSISRRGTSLRPLCHC